jgi:hypothetical protein
MIVAWSSYGKDEADFGDIGLLYTAKILAWNGLSLPLARSECDA